MQNKVIGISIRTATPKLNCTKNLEIFLSDVRPLDTMIVMTAFAKGL